MKKTQRQALFLAINSGVALVITLTALNALSEIFPPTILQVSLPQLLRIVWPLLALEFALCLLGIFGCIRSSKN